jgi:hypothetical protein
MEGVCNEAADECVVQPKTDGSTCDDGNPCMLTDTCRSGECIGSNPFVCTAVDQCHAAGVCDPATGMCSHPSMPDGTPCDDGDLCTRPTPPGWFTCVHRARSMPRTRRVPSDRYLLRPQKDNGRDDASLCTRTDTCQADLPGNRRAPPR